METWLIICIAGFSVGSAGALLGKRAGFPLLSIASAGLGLFSVLLSLVMLAVGKGVWIFWFFLAGGALLVLGIRMMWAGQGQHDERLGILVSGAAALVAAACVALMPSAWLPAPHIRPLAECQGVVTTFEKALLEQDRKLNQAYKKFEDAVANKYVAAIPATAEAAAQAAEQSAYGALNIHIPSDIPEDLRTVLERAQQAAAAAYFARGKIAGHMLFVTTGKGEMAPSLEELGEEHERFLTQAGVALGVAKAMVLPTIEAK